MMQQRSNYYEVGRSRLLTRGTSICVVVDVVDCDTTPEERAGTNREVQTPEQVFAGYSWPIENCYAESQPTSHAVRDAV